MPGDLKPATPDRRFKFASKLVQVERGGYFFVDVPARISHAIGKRGPIPVSALVNGRAEFTASLSPAGGGRHLLRINARNQEIAEVKVGDSVRVQITVHSRPLKVDIPADLRTALLSEGVLEAFQGFAAGKQSHIIDWIDRAARAETRERRIRLTLETTHRRREKRRVREARTGSK